MKRSIKLLSAFLAIVIAMVSLPLSVFAIDNTGTFYESDEDSYYQVKEDVFEIVELRSENSKQIHLADGNIMLVEYTGPIHRLDENGEWRDIDNSISLVGNEYGTSDARVKFAKKITGNESLFTLHDGKYKLTMSLEGAAKKTEGIVSNNENDTKSMTKVEKFTTLSNLSSEIVYNDILDGVDIQYKIISNNIKENIIVNEKKDTYTYTFHLTLNNLIAELNESGDIELSDDKTGELFAIIPKGFMFDANKAYSKDVSYALASSGNGKYTMTLTADAQWINAEDRAFPVTIDPPIYTSSSQILDTYVNSVYNSASFDVSSVLAVGDGITSYIKSTSLISLPNSATITSATLQLYMIDSATQGGNIGAYAVTSSWNETLTYDDTIKSLPEGATSTSVLDYAEIQPNVNNVFYTWDITSAAKDWYDGGENFGIALKDIDISGYVLFNSADATATNKPVFTVTYSDMKGIESYYSTTAQSAGFAGTGYINNANGQLAFLIDTLSAQDSIFGFTPGLIYNSHVAGSYYTASNSESTLKSANAGYGFKLNMTETVKMGVSTSATGSLESRYILTDSDGTEHYFLAGTKNGTTVYKDEDGLGLTLTEDSTHYIITDESHTVRKYTKYNSSTSYINTGGILSSITDKNGNRLNFTLDSRGRTYEISMTPKGSSAITYFKIGYNDSGLVNIIRNVKSGEAYVLYYSTSTTGTSVSPSGNGYLRKIARVHQVNVNTNESDWTAYIINGSHSNIVTDATAEYTYTSAGLLASATDNFSQRAIKYTYVNGKVSTAYETAVTSSKTGQKIGFTYQNGATEIRSSGKDDTYSSTDDIITRYVFDRRGRTVSAYSTNYTRDIIYGASNGEYESNDENANLTNRLKTSSVIGGLYTNLLTNGAFEMSDSSLSAWTLSNATKAVSNVTGRYVKINSGGSISQTVRLTPGTYTLSAEFKVPNSGGNVVLSAQFSGQTFEKNLVKSNTSSAETSCFDSLTFTITGSINPNVTISIKNSLSSGMVSVDNVMLERNVGASNSSMVSNGDFNLSRNYWNYVGNPGSTTGTGSEPAEFGNVLRVEGAIGERSFVYQDLWADSTSNPISNSKPQSFVIAGMAKAPDSVQSSKAAFAIRVKVTYSIGGVEKEPITCVLPFSSDTTQWQYVSGTFTVPSGAVIHSMRIFCDFSFNQGYSYFDKISVCPTSGAETTNYRYNDDGKLFMEYNSNSVTVYNYNTNGDVKRIITNGTDVEYTYSGYNITKEMHYSHPHILNTGAEDMSGISITSRVGEHMTLYTYNTYGLCTSTTTYKTHTTVADKIVSTQTYNTTSGSAIFGALTSETDSYGNTTNYYYNTTKGYLESTKGPDGKGVAYTYDALGRMEFAQAVTFSGSTHTALGKGEIDYSYTGALLTGIQSESTQYTLTYDEFGNTKTIKAGNNKLAEYDYNSYNGKLNKLTYGNGNTVEYKYDALDRISSIWYNGAEAYRYFYDSDGNLYRYEDLISETAQVYRYDRQNRLIQYYEYDLDTEAELYNSHVEYDEQSRVSSLKYNISYNTTGTISYSTAYTYNNDSTLATLKTDIGGGKYYMVTPTYDNFGRTTAKVTKLSDGVMSAINTVNYTYKSHDNVSTQTGGLVSRYDSTVGSSTTTYRYTYDKNGNITAIHDASGIMVAKYTYDNLGQLTREDNMQLNKTYTYAYDNAGNITSIGIYGYNMSSIESIISLSYDSSWGDLLKGVNVNGLANHEHTHDAIGNPLTYYNDEAYTFTWTQGRRLATVTKGGKNLSFTYNDEGIRTKKTVNGVEHFYTLDGTKILTESWGDELLVYIYDETGSPIGMRYRKGTGSFTDFLFEKNLQGDIIAIYDVGGSKLVSYKYNAYGVCFTTNNTTNTTLLDIIEHNPFRYRGYYYDQELEFYCLNSRYYDPYMGRFINADSMMAGISGDVQGYNLFVYGFNNPVNMSDYTGNWPRWITAAVAVVAAVVAVAATATGNVVVASIATKVCVVATIAYVAQSHHYDKRAEKNVNLPETPQIADSLGWRNSDDISEQNPNGGGPSADCHKYTSPNNVKYVSPDGHREVIFNSSNKMVTDPRDIGTYNFCPSGTFWGSIGHFFADMLPWYLFGNNDDDPGPLANEIICFFE